MGCSVEGCERPARCRGMCHRHYENWRMRGDPVPVRDRDDAWFFAHIGWDVVSDCHVWRGNRNEHGYGTMRMKRAHRVAWEIAHGPIPVGLHVLHSCDNPPCVNVEHLRLGTDADNVADMVERGRHHTAKWTACSNGHPYPPGRVPGTVCRECANERNRRYMAKQRR